MGRQRRYSRVKKNQDKSPPIQRRTKEVEHSPATLTIQRQEMGGGDRQPSSAPSSKLDNSGSILDRFLKKEDSPPNNQAIQRAPLGIYSDPPLNDNELNTDNMLEIRQYIAQNEENGRQDLNRLLIDAVRRKDKSKLQEIQEFSNAHATDSTKKQVPKTIHLIWIGNRIGSGEVANIESIYESIKFKHEWQVILWTDQRMCSFLDSAESINELAANPDFVIRKDLRSQVDDKVIRTYDIAYQKASQSSSNENMNEDEKKVNTKGGFTMMSDLARYSILLNQGGIYMDVDLNLGNADVDEWNMEMSDEHGLPAFGPNIQYIDDMEKNLMNPGLIDLTGSPHFTTSEDAKNDLENGVKKGFEKMFKDNLEEDNPQRLSQNVLSQAQNINVFDSDDNLSRKTRVAAMIHYIRGTLSNNLVAAPPNQKFMRFMIDKISERLETKDGDFLPGMVPSITGPSGLTEIIIGFYREEEKSGDKGAPKDSHQKSILMDPNWIAQLIQVEWLTAVQKARYFKDQEEQQLQQDITEEQAPSKGCCYITTACVEQRGLADDCEELTVLRQFRDNYLIKKANGRRLLELYYKHSPQIVAAIHNRDDEDEILERLYRIIQACVEAIKAGDNEFAFQTYCRMVIELKDEFIPECQVDVPSFVS